MKKFVFAVALLGVSLATTVTEAGWGRIVRHSYYAPVVVAPAPVVVAPPPVVVTRAVIPAPVVVSRPVFFAPPVVQTTVVQRAYYAPAVPQVQYRVVAPAYYSPGYTTNFFYVP